MNNLHIMRAGYSAYFNKNFAQQEKEMISKFGNFCENFNHYPDILITNTETKIEELEQQGYLKNVSIIHPT